MSKFGIFAELDDLKQKMKNLEEKIQEERYEFKDIYLRMKTENDILKAENILLQKKITEYYSSDNDTYTYSSNM
jgi:regulator of replication initiation timing